MPGSGRRTSSMSSALQAVLLANMSKKNERSGSESKRFPTNMASSPSPRDQKQQQHHMSPRLKQRLSLGSAIAPATSPDHRQSPRRRSMLTVAELEQEYDMIVNGGGDDEAFSSSPSPTSIRDIKGTVSKMPFADEIAQKAST